MRSDGGLGVCVVLRVRLSTGRIFTVFVLGVEFEFEFEFHEKIPLNPDLERSARSQT